MNEIAVRANADDVLSAACLGEAHLDDLARNRPYAHGMALRKLVNVLSENGALDFAESLQARYIDTIRARYGGKSYEQDRRHAELLIQMRRPVQAALLIAALDPVEIFVPDHAAQESGDAVLAPLFAAAPRSDEPGRRYRLRQAAERLIRSGQFGRAEAAIAAIANANSGECGPSQVNALRFRLSTAKGDYRRAEAALARNRAEPEACNALHGPMVVEFAERLLAAGQAARADVLYASLLEIGGRPATRPTPFQREIMAKRAKALEKLGRPAEAEFHELPVKIASAVEAERWPEATALIERMNALAPLAGGEPARAMALEFRAAARNLEARHAPAPYSLPQSVRLCEPPPGYSSAIQPAGLVAGRAAPLLLPEKERFDFTSYPLNTADPDGALYRASERFVGYSESCGNDRKIAMLEAARELYRKAGYGIAIYADLAAALADAHANAGDFTKADAIYTELIDVQAKGGAFLTDWKNGTLSTLFETALRFYLSYGKYERAETHLRRFLSGQESGNRSLLIDIYLLQGKYAQAFEALERDGSGRLPPDLSTITGDLGPNHPLNAYADRQRRLAQSHLAAGRPGVAIGTADAAMNRIEAALAAIKWRYPRDADYMRYATKAPLERVKADAHYDLGAFAEAAKAYQAAATSSQQYVQAYAPDTVIKSVRDFARLAETAVRAGDPQTAKAGIAAADAAPTFDLDLGDEARTALWSAKVALGIRSAEALPSGLEAGRAMFEALEKRWAIGSQSAIDTDWQRRELREDNRRYSDYASLLWAGTEGRDAGALRRAFGAVQRGLLDTADLSIAVAAARALVARDRPAAIPLLKERDDLVKAYQSALSGEFATDAAAKPGSDPLGAMTARLTELDARIAGLAPEYFALIRSEPLDESDASALLVADEAVLMIFPGAFGTQLMAVTREGVAWRQSQLTDAQLGTAVRRLLWFAGGNVEVSHKEEEKWNEQVDGGPNGFDRDTAFHLHQQLVEPVRPALAGKKTLFVAAAGALSSLPFAMLVSSAPQGKDDDPGDLRGTHWFGDDFALVQIPSLQALALLRNTRRSTAASGSKSEFMGFGNPALSGSAETRGARGRARGPGATIADARELRALASLPGTAVELKAMAAALGAPASSLHLGRAANETVLKAAKLDATGILAFATHGLVAGEVKGVAEPGLVFTPPAMPSLIDDGLLTTSEIALLRLNADWVILSACNTAAGDGSGGAPGMSGLARAFFFAGARNLLASHWPVRDDVAARLTVRAVEIARATPGLSRAESLKRAMKEIRDERSKDGARDEIGIDASWAHPNAWAPFTMIGDGGP